MERRERREGSRGREKREESGGIGVEVNERFI